MNKHCGQTKFTFLVAAAALFCFTLAALQSRADNISVGDGVLNMCWDGHCPILPSGEVNVILGESVSIHISGKATNKDGLSINDLDDPFYLMFITPVQNLLYPFNSEFVPTSSLPPGALGGEFNYPPTVAFSENNITGAALYQGFEGPPPSGSGETVTWEFNDHPSDVGNAGFHQDLPVGDSNLFNNSTAPTHGRLYEEFLMLPGDSGPSNTFDKYAGAMHDVPYELADDPVLAPILAALGLDVAGFRDLLIPASEITGFRVWVYELSASGLFGDGDTINVDTTGMPLGTVVAAWGGVGCDNPESGQRTCDSYLLPPFTKIAVMMPLPEFGGEIPEPTSLLLLGTGLLAVGKKLRKRQKAQDQNIT